MTQQSSSPRYPEQTQRVGLALDRTSPPSILTAAGSKETQRRHFNTSTHDPYSRPYTTFGSEQAHTQILYRRRQHAHGHGHTWEDPLTMLVLAATISKENVAGATIDAAARHGTVLYGPVRPVRPAPMVTYCTCSVRRFPSERATDCPQRHPVRPWFVACPRRVEVSRSSPW